MTNTAAASARRSSPSSPASAATCRRSIPYLGDRPDVGPYLDRLAHGAQPEFLVVAGNRSEAEEIIRQARKRGLKMPILGGDGLEGIQDAGALAEGVYLSSPYFPSIPSAPNRRFVAGVPTEVSGRRDAEPAGGGDL